MSSLYFKNVTIAGCNFHVSDQYDIDTVIGGGDYGIVIKAVDKTTQKNVAIKRLKNPFNHTINAVKAYREFVLLQIVDHKNVINLLNAYTPQDDLSKFEEVYFVMDFMDYTLRDVISMRATQFDGPYGGRKISYLIYQLLCGVNHLHQVGIAHRDLTPDNVMIDNEYRLKIVDFGMARQIDISRDRTKNVTHPYYRAPEVFFSKNYDFKADVWSIGCIFAELLTGNFLFRGLDDFDQLIQIIKIVGTPDENYLLKLENSVQIIFRTLAKRVGVKWEELFPDDIFPEEKKKKFCSAENGRRLLSLMLIFDPDQRISVEKALEESYVAWKRNSDNNDSPPKAIYDDSLENMKLTTGEWKKIIFEKIKNYEQTNQD